MKRLLLKNWKVADEWEYLSQILNKSCILYRDISPDDMGFAMIEYLFDLRIYRTKANNIELYKPTTEFTYLYIPHFKTRWNGTQVVVMKGMRVRWILFCLKIQLFLKNKNNKWS